LIPLPLALVAGPLVIAVIIYLIRRLTILTSILCVTAAIALAWFINAAPTSDGETFLGGWVVGGEQVILGRSLVFAPVDRPVLLVLYVATAALFAIAAVLPKGNNRPDDAFYPGLMGLLGIVAAVLVTETFVFSVLLVQVAAVLITALIQGARFGSTRGAWRFFLFSTLALPLLLVAGWQIDFQAANPGQTDLLNPAVLLLTLGFAIYLAAFPFHQWLAPAARDAHPLVQPIAFGFFHVITLSVISQALEQFPWFAESHVPLQWFAFLGTVTTGVGTILAFSSASFGQLSGYTLLVDLGGLMLVLGSGDQAGHQVAWTILILRIVSLTVWGIGLAIVQGQSGSDQISDTRGLGQSLPLAAAVLLLGGLGLAGFPPGPGFSGRWMATGLVARESMGRAGLLLLGSASGMVGMIRMARTLFRPAPSQDRKPAGNQGRLAKTVALVTVLLAALFLNFYPNPITATAGEIASYLSR
jgi:multicomponent Na+:H+ antiporter subunit D